MRLSHFTRLALLVACLACVGWLDALSGVATAAAAVAGEPDGEHASATPRPTPDRESASGPSQHNAHISTGAGLSWTRADSEPRDADRPWYAAADNPARRAFDRLTPHLIAGARLDHAALPRAIREQYRFGAERIAYLRQVRAALAAIPEGDLDLERAIDARMADRRLARDIEVYDTEAPQTHDPSSYITGALAVPRVFAVGAAAMWVDRIDGVLRRVSLMRRVLTAPYADLRAPALASLAGLLRQIDRTLTPRLRWQRFMAPETVDLLLLRIRVQRPRLANALRWLGRHPGTISRTDAEIAASARRAFIRRLFYDHGVTRTATALRTLGEAWWTRCESKLAEIAEEMGFASWQAAVEALKTRDLDTRDVPAIIRGQLDRLAAWFEANPIMPMPTRIEQFELSPQRPRRTNTPYAVYRPLDVNGTRNGAYVIILPPENASEAVRQAKLRDLYPERLEVITIHEVLPGHHLQYAAIGDLQRSPLRRALGWNAAYVEGWAHYCEKMMVDVGYATTPAQRLAMWTLRLWRAGRVRIDVGLHCFGMTPDAAVALLREGVQLEEVNARAEVARYVISPTQPMSYLTGALVIERLLAEAREQLGDAFDLRAFHAQILNGGPIPVDLLRARVLGVAAMPARRTPPVTPCAFPAHWLAPTWADEIETLLGYPALGLGSGVVVAAVDLGESTGEAGSDADAGVELMVEFPLGTLVAHGTSALVTNASGAQEIIGLDVERARVVTLVAPPDRETADRGGVTRVLRIPLMAHDAGAGGEGVGEHAPAAGLLFPLDESAPGGDVATPGRPGGWDVSWVGARADLAAGPPLSARLDPWPLARLAHVLEWSVDGQVVAHAAAFSRGDEGGGIDEWPGHELGGSGDSIDHRLDQLAIHDREGRQIGWFVRTHDPLVRRLDVHWTGRVQMHPGWQMPEGDALRAVRVVLPPRVTVPTAPLSPTASSGATGAED